MINFDIAKQLDDARVIIEEAKKKLSYSVNETIDTSLAYLFNKYDDLKEINVVGFVPYFNDGDPCIFGIHDITVTVASKFADTSATKEEDDYSVWDDDEDSVWDDDEDDYKIFHLDVFGGLGYKDNEFYDDGSQWSSFSRDINALVNFFYSNVDVLNEVYGDHFELYINKDGVEVEEYTNHD